MYDLGGIDNLEGNSGFDGMNIDPSEIFSMFFQNGSMGGMGSDSFFGGKKNRRADPFAGFSNFSSFGNRNN